MRLREAEAERSSPESSPGSATDFFLVDPCKKEQESSGSPSPLLQDIQCGWIMSHGSVGGGGSGAQDGWLGLNSEDVK